MIEELLPCPKCNSSAKLKQISDWSCRIECSNEDCCIETYQDDKNTLIENWNTRPSVIPDDYHRAKEIFTYLNSMPEDLLRIAVSELDDETLWALDKKFSDIDKIRVIPQWLKDEINSEINTIKETHCDDRGHIEFFDICAISALAWVLSLEDKS